MENGNLRGNYCYLLRTRRSPVVLCLLIVSLSTLLRLLPVPEPSGMNLEDCSIGSEGILRELRASSRSAQAKRFPKR